MVSKARTVTLLTDFGTRDHYIASMKGVLLAIDPELHIVDITHEVPKFDIRRAALLLANSAKFFPHGTIHVAVVDPGVGTSRRPIIIKTKNYYFVGPDNGVLSVAAAGDGVKHVYQIREDGSYVLQRRSSTFAGRDVFAPVAAHIAKGVPLEMLGEVIKSFKRIRIGEPKRFGNRIDGDVLLIDAFGNIVTNIGDELIEDLEPGQRILVNVGGKLLRVPFLKTYGDVERGKPLALVGSTGLLEIGLNQGSISCLLRNVKEGSRVSIQYSRK